MTTISNQFSAPPIQLPVVRPLHGVSVGQEVNGTRPRQGQSSDQLRATFTQFVGETFFGQMIKSMRSTVGKPAYFYGGRAEEAFRGQLDQKLAEHMTKASAERFAQPMFHQQFPNLGDDASSEAAADPTRSLNQLQQLTRR